MSENVIEQAVKALAEARETIHTFHGEVAWDIYAANAPEMKRLDSALASLRKAAEGAQVRWLDKWSLYDYDRKVPGCVRGIWIPDGKEPR